MASYEVKHCANCEQHGITHEFQDNTYGKYNRVFNVSEKGNMSCTVCNNGSNKKK